RQDVAEPLLDRAVELDAANPRRHHHRILHQWSSRGPPIGTPGGRPTAPRLIVRCRAPTASVARGRWDRTIRRPWSPRSLFSVEHGGRRDGNGERGTSPSAGGGGGGPA